VSLSIRRDNFSELVSRARRSRAIHNRPDGNLDYFRDGGASVFLLPLPVCAAPGLDDRLVEKIRKIIGVDIRTENDISTATAIAPVRSAAWYEFFATEADAAPPAVTGLGKNFYSIDKHKGAFSRGVWTKCHRLGRLSSRAAGGRVNGEGEAPPEPKRYR
jgi:hypothetical protein